MALTKITAGGLGDDSVVTASVADSQVTLAKTTGIVGDSDLHASSWRMHTGISQPSGNATAITSNWEEVDTHGYGRLGSAMTESSGLFTFPATGIWRIDFSVNFIDDQNYHYWGGGIYTTTDGSAYSLAASSFEVVYNSTGDTYSSSYVNFIFDVTATATHKCSFGLIHSISTGDTVIRAETDQSQTWAHFTKLGNT